MSPCDRVLPTPAESKVALMQQRQRIVEQERNVRYKDAIAVSVRVDTWLTTSSIATIYVIGRDWLRHRP